MGMRVERTFRHRTGLLRHLPTGAALAVTARRDLTEQWLHEHADDEPSPAYAHLTIKHPLTTGREHDRIEMPPTPGRDAARLLGATPESSMRSSAPTRPAGTAAYPPGVEAHSMAGRRSDAR
jgi:hypothetical protein